MLDRRETSLPATTRLVAGAHISTFDGVGVAVLHDTVIAYWTSAASAARVEWAFDAAERARGASSDGVLVLQLIMPSSSPPGAAALRVAHQRFADRGVLIRRMVTVPLGDEFWTAIVRSIMRGVFLVSGHSKRHVVAMRERAVGLLLEQGTTVSPTHDEIERAIHELERLLGVHSPVTALRAAARTRGRA